MITITKERLLTIQQWRETYGPGSNVVLPAEEAEELARIALASLEAEPVASCIIEDGCMCVDGFGEYVGHSLPDGTHQLYTAPPALVVPDKLPREYIRGWPLAYSDYAEGWNDCRKAMLQGSQPVSQTYKLNELSGNSPVTPDGWVMVPKKLTAENGAKGVLSGEFSETTFISCPECFGDDDCDTCDGSGRIEIKVPVTWTTIKSIWDKGIAHFAAKPPQEVNRG
ncbi:DUF550 domain-containing protein [Escherichia coli]